MTTRSLAMRHISRTRNQHGLVGRSNDGGGSYKRHCIIHCLGYEGRRGGGAMASALPWREASAEHLTRLLPSIITFGLGFYTLVLTIPIISQSSPPLPSLLLLSFPRAPFLVFPVKASAMLLRRWPCPLGSGRISFLCKLPTSVGSITVFPVLAYPFLGSWAKMEASKGNHASGT